MRQAGLRTWLSATIVFFVALAHLAVVSAQPQTTAPAPTLTPAEMAEFLRSGEVVSSKVLSTGVTRPLKLTLKSGSMTHDAVFQTINQSVPIQRMKNGRTELNFRDSYHFNIAAYTLAGHLGLGGMVPVTVERKWDGKLGSLSWWIDWKWDETSRMKENVRPPDPVTGRCSRAACACSASSCTTRSQQRQPADYRGLAFVDGGLHARVPPVELAVPRGERAAVQPRPAVPGSGI